ncbi:hypothetical protein CEXT_533621 [Caerostris extrusa]|uniref:Uncharacterized protein n=1 Tax=Caerostris extrusa TaxID=172846 RepID=A0AAV4NSA1_CAEEX|nr:hypothetical protein CEXT_533621 [Caerostris extrusa]
MRLFLMRLFLQVITVSISFLFVPSPHFFWKFSFIFKTNAQFYIQISNSLTAEEIYRVTALIGARISVEAAKAETGCPSVIVTKAFSIPEWHTIFQRCVKCAEPP